MIQLNKISTLPPEDVAKKESKKQLKKHRDKLYSLQNKLYADGRYSILIVLQGLDTSGKDGSIRHAFKGMNPQGINVKSFKKPTEDEVKHDFLWRIYPHFPEKGMIKVFNRSYYEDILVPKVNGSHSSEELQHRMNLINQLEQHLISNGTMVLKFFLHISPEEQKERIAERKKKTHKRWKYSPEDEKIPKQWKDFEAAYQMVLSNCNVVPWHIIPSDKRWYRNCTIAGIVRQQLENLDLKYPSLNGR